MQTAPVVAFVADVPDFKGGAERSLFDLMANPGIFPLLVVPGDGPMAEAARGKGIPVYYLNFGKVLTVRRPFKAMDVLRTFFDALSAAWQLRGLARDNGALCIHTNGLKAHGVGCLSRLLGGVPVVVHFRAIPFTRLEMMFWQAVRLIASRIILVSRPCWPGARLPGHVRVIFNGIVLKAHKVPKPKAPPPLVLGFVGRIQFTKGVDTLIEWFDYARKQGLDLRLKIRGEAAPDELDYDRKVRRMAKDRGLEKLCVFEGRVEGFDRIYGGIHVNVVSSVIPDPLPRSVMEACSLGIPVLGYPAGGIPYMIEDGVSGFLVDGPERFCEVLRALGDAKVYARVSRAAVARAKACFGMERLHAQVMEVYESLR